MLYSCLIFPANQYAEEEYTEDYGGGYGASNSYGPSNSYGGYEGYGRGYGYWKQINGQCIK